MSPFAQPFRRLLAFAAVLSLVACKDATLNATVASLRFILLPTSVMAGEPFVVEIELLNPSGERASDSRASVLIRLVGNATLTGVTTVEASQGVARFEGLELTLAGSTFILEAEAATFTSQSVPFAVAPSAPSGEQSTATAPATPLFPFGPTELTFTFKDEFGNVIPQVAVSVAASQVGSTLTPSSGTTNAAGRFVSQFLPSGEGTVSFTATVAGAQLTLGTSLAIVDPCPPAAMTFPGVTQGTVPSGSCTAGGLPAASHRFIVAAASGVSFAVGSPFQPQLEVQTDPPGANVRLIATADMQALEWLLPIGTYRFRVGAVAGGGAYNVTSALVPGNTGQTVRSLVAAGTYAGQTLDAGDRVVFDDGTVGDLYLIFSDRPCTITMRSAAFDSYLAIYNAVTGAGVIDDDDSGGGTDAQLTVSPCSTASAPLLIVTNHWPGAMGAYTLTISFAGSSPAVRAALRAGDAPSALSPIAVPSIGVLRFPNGAKVKR